MTPTASHGPAPLLGPSRLDLLLKDLEVPSELKEAALAWAESLRFAQIPELPITDGELEVLVNTHEVTVSADQLAEDAWLLVNEAQVRTESPRRCSPIKGKLETELNAAVDAAWEA